MIKTILLCSFLILIAPSLFAQFENVNNSVRFENTDTNTKSDTGFELPAVTTPSLINNPYSKINAATFGKNVPDPVDVTKGDGLVDYKTDKTPKYFSKDKEAKPEYGADQYLGDFKTSSKKVTIMYRDHEMVDGDRVRIFLNDVVVENNVYLDSSYNGITITMDSGFNRIDFVALNQGSSGPNTAQLTVLEENGETITTQEWNLLTGRKATIIVVKD